MRELMKLPVNCDRLVLLDETTMAAWGKENIYFCTLQSSTPSTNNSNNTINNNTIPNTITNNNITSSSGVVSMDLPKHVDAIAPWHPPGASLQHCGVFYIMDGNIHFRRCSSAASEQSCIMQLPSNCDNVRELNVCFGTTLVIRTDSDVLFYALDPSSNAAITQLPLIGRVALPSHPTGGKGKGRRSEGKRRNEKEKEKEKEEEEEEEDTMVMMYASPSPTHSAQMPVDVDCTIAIVQYCRSLRYVDVLLFAVTPAHVALLRRTRNGGLSLPSNMNILQSCDVNWLRQELLLLLLSCDNTDLNNNNNNNNNNNHNNNTNKSNKNQKKEHMLCVLQLQTMEWGPTPPPLAAIPQSITAVQFTHTGEMWALTERNEKCVKLIKCSAGSVMREVELPHLARNDNVRLATWGARVFVLFGKNIMEIQSNQAETNSTTGGSTLCDWLLLKTTKEDAQSTKQMRKEMTREINEVVAFVEGNDNSCRTMIVRDVRYVSSAPDTTGVYQHAILDAMEGNSKRTDINKNASLVKYIAVAQSLHPATILRVLHVPDGSLRLSIAVLLAAKSSLTAGGVRLLEWGTPVRSFSRIMGKVETKQFAAALYESALAALAAGALAAVEFLCAVADIVMIAVVGNKNNNAAAVISREEAEVEEVIAQALGLLSSYAQWALTAAPALGVITAHVGPQREGKKEAAVRDRIAHAINTSRSVQIEPMILGRR